MKNVKLKLAVLGAFSVLSAQAMATGLVSLPTAGVSVAASTNQPAGTTGWALCNTTGNYGSGTYTAPTTSANNTCAVFPGGARNLTTSPVSTIATAVAAKTTTTITANSETLGTLGQRTWRNAGSTECIFAKYIDFATTGSFDYNPQLAGSQRFEANDIALGGFSTTATVQAGYYYTATTDSPVFRMGRSFTSVQMQSNAAGTAPATGFVHLPINGPSVPASGTEINGVGQTASSTGTPPGPNPGSVVPTAAQQTSEIRTNWVDFVLDNTGGVDEDGTTSQNSPVLYVQAACNGSTANTAGTIRIRQTGQETQPWVTILATGQTRVGANASF
ncbi:hypothetical protein [Methylotenera sp.]|uniref:hypothetical protein n=1 Tax=Methylotenera sp. TaxID=2051956 RepID=UPI002487C1E2|nr:hypothetical protein [Methylotenera sp.]MDI1361628.1 hypothetical protein [Methylotenera sp.]